MSAKTAPSRNCLPVASDLEGTGFSPPAFERAPAGLQTTEGAADRLPLPAVARSASWLHMGQPWRAADAVYQAHHWQCVACRSAAAGHADRCHVGQHMHAAYYQAVGAAMQADPMQAHGQCAPVGCGPPHQHQQPEQQESIP